MIKYLIIIAFVSWTMTLGAIAAKNDNEDRTVNVTWNPDCENFPNTTCSSTNANGSYTNLVYVQLIGKTDVIHLLYSDIQGFSIVFARTNLTGKLSVNWDQLLAGQRENMTQALKFSEVPIEWFAYEIGTIIEFDDSKGTADMTQANETYNHLTKEFIWKKFNVSDDSGLFEG